MNLYHYGSQLRREVTLYTVNIYRYKAIGANATSSSHLDICLILHISNICQLQQRGHSGSKKD